MGRMDGKVVFITGAARGQGRSHALRLAQEGADIIAIDICNQISTVPYPMASQDDLDETARLVRAAGRRVVATKVDVRDRSAVSAAVAAGVDELGRLDCVVANAGIFSLGVSYEMDDSTWQDVIDVNLTGVWKTCCAAIPHLIAGGVGGSVVLVSSNMGLKSAFNIVHYVASKHGLVGLMRGLARELAPHMIRVNTVHPTNTATPMILNDYVYSAFCPDSVSPGPSELGETLRAWQEMPIDWVESGDVSNAVLFLCSDQSRYVTGTTLPIDGGSLLK